MIKYFFVFCITSIIVFSCGKKTTVGSPTQDSTFVKMDSTQAKTNNNISENDIEAKVIDAVMLLPEMVKQANEIEEKSGGKSRLAAIILETPDENGKGYYVVKVAEDDDLSLVGLYNFNIYYPSMKMMWINPMDAEELTLDEWRKTIKLN